MHMFSGYCIIQSAAHHSKIQSASAQLNSRLNSELADLLTTHAFTLQHAPHPHWICHQTTWPETLRETIQTHCNQAELECNWLTELFNWQNFRLVAMDMDSTLITIECIDELADYYGKKAAVAAITQAAMRGEIRDFNESLQRRVALLAGLPASNLEAVYNERLQLSPGATTLLQTVQAQGLKTLLVSGGFTFFTEKLKARLGLDFTRANTLEIIDGKLTGRVLGTIVNDRIKAETVRQICHNIAADTRQAIIIGDGSNDLKMMALGGLSIAFRAKPIVRQQASQTLNFVGLDGILPWFATS